MAATLKSGVLMVVLSLLLSNCKTTVFFDSVKAPMEHSPLPRASYHLDSLQNKLSSTYIGAQFQTNQLSGVKATRKVTNGGFTISKSYLKRNEKWFKDLDLLNGINFGFSIYGGAIGVDEIYEVGDAQKIPLRDDLHFMGLNFKMETAIGILRIGNVAINPFFTTFSINQDFGSYRGFRENTKENEDINIIDMTSNGLSVSIGLGFELQYIFPNRKGSAGLVMNYNPNIRSFMLLNLEGGTSSSLYLNLRSYHINLGINYTNTLKVLEKQTLDEKPYFNIGVFKDLSFKKHQKARMRL